MPEYSLAPEQVYFLRELESRLGNREELFAEMKIVSDLSGFWKFLQKAERSWIRNKEMKLSKDSVVCYGLDLYVLNHEISITLTVLLKVKYGMPDSILNTILVESHTMEGELSLDSLLLEILEASMDLV